jgi:hypothetical protein
LPGAETTALELLYQHTIAITETMWQIRSSFSFQYSSGINLLGPIATFYTIMAYVNIWDHGPVPFNRAVQIIREHGHLGFVPFILAGIKVLGDTYRIRFTPEVQGYLRVLEGRESTFSDISMEMPVEIHAMDPPAGGEVHVSLQLPYVETLSSLLKRYNGLR